MLEAIVMASPTPPQIRFAFQAHYTPVICEGPSSITGEKCQFLMRKVLSLEKWIGHPLGGEQDRSLYDSAWPS